MPSKPKPNRFGTALKRLIKQRHLSQQAFALKVRETTGVRIAQGMLSEVLNGKVAVPRHWCPAIAQTFGITETQRKQLDAAAASDYGLQVDIPPLPKTTKAAGDHPAAMSNS